MKKQDQQVGSGWTHVPRGSNEPGATPARGVRCRAVQVAGPREQVVQRTTSPAAHYEHILPWLSCYCQEAAEVRLLAVNLPYHLALMVGPGWCPGPCPQVQPCPGPSTSGCCPAPRAWYSLEQSVACGVGWLAATPDGCQPVWTMDMANRWPSSSFGQDRKLAQMWPERLSPRWLDWVPGHQARLASTGATGTGDRA